MKFALSLILFLAFVPAITSNVAAQDASGTAQAADQLRLQLLDTQAKEAELQARERQLDEDLKPENIERSLAGIGSTKPEDLRELRRRQLNTERESVRAQLKIVATSRERLESLIRTADAEAYHRSAEAGVIPATQALEAQSAVSPRWLVGTVAGLVAVLGIVLVIAVIRRFTST